MLQSKNKRKYNIMKLLIIEDDENIVSFLKVGFEEDGYIIDIALNGEDGEYLASVNKYDVIILDWMLPLKNGIEVLSSLREQNITTPILMLTAKGEIDDKIKGLKSGCDDYLSKPFSFEELEARIEALYRRSISLNATNEIKFKNISIDIDSKIIKKDEKILNLSLKEYDLLLFLIQHKNSYVSKPMIEEGLWNEDEFILSNVIQVTVHNLRKKIGKEFIKSFRGMGYKIEI